MRNIYYLIVLLLSITATAQEIPADIRPEIKVGNRLKAILPPTDSRLGYYDIYMDIDMKEPYTDLPFEKQKELLLGKEFIIEHIGPVTWDSYDTNYHKDKFIRCTIRMKCTNGTIIYYNYDNAIDNFFTFVLIHDTPLPEDFYCYYIKQRKYFPKGTYDIRYPIDRLYFVRDMVKGKPVYGMSYRQYIKGGPEKNTGFTLLLENDKCIDWPDAVIETEPIIMPDGYIYFFKDESLSPEQIELLRKYKIIGVRMVGQEQTIDKGEKIQGVVNCMYNAK